MALRAKKPTIVEQRMKALFYGAAGVGKSTAAIQFPKPYWIDTEGSSDKKSYVDFINQQGGAVYATQDFDELINELKALLSEKHEYKTLIIDSLTILYDDLLHKAEEKVGNEFGRHYGEANKKMKHLLNLLLRLDMNVLITSHSKSLYVNDGKKMEVVGQTFDCYKKLDYLFDIVFEIQQRGDTRVGIIKKSRYECFKHNEQFPFSYDEIANRYGRHILERSAVAQVLASKEQIEQLKKLIELFKEPEEVVQKWLDKANAMSFDEMSEELIVKCITFMENKIKPQGDK